MSEQTFINNNSYIVQVSNQRGRVIELSPGDIVTGSHYAQFARPLATSRKRKFKILTPLSIAQPVEEIEEVVEEVVEEVNPQDPLDRLANAPEGLFPTVLTFHNLIGYSRANLNLMAEFLELDPDDYRNKHIISRAILEELGQEVEEESE